MAIKAGRVGVDPSQVTLEGKIKGGGVSPEVLTKEEARRIYQTIAGMVDYLTKNSAELTYQKISDMVNYQLKLVSGTNIKRINGEDLLGSGNISVLTNEIASGIYQTISGMSIYALKSDLPDTSDLLTKTEAPGYDDILTRTSANLLLNNKLSIDGSSINIMPTGSDVNDMIGGVSYFPGGCLNTPTSSGCLVISGGDDYSDGIQLAYTYDMGLYYRLKLSQNNWSAWVDLLVSIRNAISSLQTDVGTLQNDVTTMDGEIGDLTTLNTTNKNNLVNAINEVNEKSTHADVSLFNVNNIPTTYSNYTTGDMSGYRMFTIAACLYNNIINAITLPKSLFDFASTTGRNMRVVDPDINCTYELYKVDDTTIAIKGSTSPNPDRRVKIIGIK